MRDSKMTVSPMHIWKSATDSTRMPNKSRERYLHIGSTLRNLYFTQNPPKTEGALSDLLADLEAAEEQTKGDTER